MQVKSILGVHIQRELLPLKVEATYYELMQLWIFNKSNYFSEAVEEFRRTGKKIDFKEANKFKSSKMRPLKKLLRRGNES